MNIGNLSISKENILKNRFLYFIKSPGWKHDGSGKNSEELRQEWIIENEHDI